MILPRSAITGSERILIFIKVVSVPKEGQEGVYSPKGSGALTLSRVHELHGIVVPCKQNWLEYQLIKTLLKLLSTIDAVSVSTITAANKEAKQVLDLSSTAGGKNPTLTSKCGGCT